jgi:SPP1 family predicted phage head-tail adaptor
MNPGIMRDRFTMEVDVGTEKDRLGAPVPIWESEFEDWCSYEPVGTREFPTIQKRNSESTVRFRIRYRADVASDPNTYAAEHRIVFTLEPDASPTAARIFNIFPPIPNAARTEIIIEGIERATP